MKSNHFGATTQRAYRRYANHTQIMCHACQATLVGDTIDHGFADGSGRFSKDCPHCYERTFYDGPLPMAVPIKVPAGHKVELTPFVQMPKPKPHPRPIWMDRKPMPMTYVVRALIVIWCVAAFWVSTK